MASGYRAWHRALVTVCLGRDLDGTGQQDHPDIPAIVALLRPHLPEVSGRRAAAAAQGRAWPYPLPTELSQGLPAAQFGAALHAVRSELGLLAAVRAPTPGPLPGPNAEDRRLRADRPPHWG